GCAFSYSEVDGWRKQPEAYRGDAHPPKFWWRRIVLSRYIRKPLTKHDLDSMRINLSVIQHKLSEEPTCDFCGSSTPAWLYASFWSSAGEFGLRWRWTA